MAALPQPGETVSGKYRVERVIGRGGMSVVFGATHLVTGKRFAIKWLAPAVESDLEEAVQRFIREAQVAGRFQHPNVVEVYDVGQTPEGAHYMLMEWLEGEALSARLERVGALGVRDAYAHLLPCMRAVEDAHAAGIIHRDLKPANIFICQANKHGPERAKVLDFGIAKLAALTPGEISPVVTQIGALIGTPYYLAPEQLRQLPVDARADVYAFGVILYQVLTGKLPFYAENFAELVLQIATGPVVPVRVHAPRVSAAIEAVVTRAMAREPAERFQDLRELIEALEAAGESGKGRARWVWVGAAAVVLGASVLWYAANSRQARGAAVHVMQAATQAPPPSAAGARNEPREGEPEPPASLPTTVASQPSAADPPASAEPSSDSQPAPAARRSKRAAPPAVQSPTPVPAAPHNPLHMQLQ